MISRNELIQLYPETLPRLEGEVQDQQLILWRINFEKNQTISENVPLLGHTGSRPTRANPTGSPLTEALPSGTFPTGILPTGTLPTGTLPTGILPTGTLPTGTLPTYMSRSEMLCFIACISVFLLSLVMLLDYAHYYTNNNNEFLK